MQDMREIYVYSHDTFGPFIGTLVTPSGAEGTSHDTFARYSHDTLLKTKSLTRGR